MNIKVSELTTLFVLIPRLRRDSLPSIIKIECLQAAAPQIHHPHVVLKGFSYPLLSMLIYAAVGNG